MMMFLRCVGEAVVAQGMRGLMGLVPFGEQIYDVAANAVERYRGARREQQLQVDLQEVLQADASLIQAEARQIARQVAAGRPAEEILKLEAYLRQVPGVARQSLRRPQDPSGTTVPAALNLEDPIQFAGLLPRRPPRFMIGNAVPHAPQWRFVELLGSGGFGEVWLARHTFLEQCRAFKFCLDPAGRERLLRHEGEVVKRVMAESAGMKSSDHGIVPLVDAFLEGDTPWLAYEYIAGGDLAGLVRQMAQAAPPQRGMQALNILRVLASIVGRFHRLPQPIVHRDLKPANILLKNDGSRWLLRITDFGISHVAADRNIRQATVSTPSLNLGETYRGAHTPLYASPQQQAGQKADVRDDVHALGMIGYQLLLADLTARRPAGKWRKRVADCGLPDAILDLLESCWDDDPDERPRDALALAEALVPTASPVPATPAAPPPAALPKASVAGPTADPVTEYARWKQQIEEMKAQAKRAADVFDYARAAAILENVPSKHRDNELLAEWSSKRDRLKEVWDRVESGWRDMSEEELAEHLEEVVGLHPDHPRAKPWLAQFGSVADRQRKKLTQSKVGAVISNDLGMKLAWVPPGKSWLGGGGGKPGTTEFTLPKGLWCGVYPVTQAEWQAVMGNNPSNFGGNPRHPVEQVSWDDVQEFLKKLTARLKGSGLTYRLPVEDEWEYICRGGPVSQSQSAYHFYFARSKTDLTAAPTNDLSSNQANFDGNYPAGSAGKGPYLERTSEVGLYLPNPLGIYDMHGNVWEWTASPEGSLRVLRGGGWNRQAVLCAASYRLGNEPGFRGSRLGFRLLAVPAV